MAPAGLMWSVVTESPKIARARAERMSATGDGSRPNPSKKGGSWMYVEAASQA